MLVRGRAAPLDLGGIERVLGQRVTEVTVCSPSFRSVEPLARVEWIHERSRDSPAGIVDRPAGEVLLGAGKRVRRRGGRITAVR
jgi:hypothetical protein